MENQPKGSVPTLREQLQELAARKFGHLTAQQSLNPRLRVKARQEANSRAVEVEEAPPEMAGRDPRPYSEEMRDMMDRAFCQSERYTDQQGRADRVGAQPEILEFERLLVRRCRFIGIPMFAHSVCRNGDDQNRLYVKGVSKARAGQSPHNYGAAVDLIHGTKGWNLTRKQWDVIGHLGGQVAKSLTLKIVWGGTWDFWDPAHWELANWREIRDAYRPE